MDTEDFKMYLSIKVGLSDNTTKAYIEKLKHFLDYLQETPITAHSIEKFLYSKKECPNTINIYIYLFRHLEAYFKDRGTPKDLSSGFKPRTIERPPVQIISQEEAKKLLNLQIAYSNRNHIFYEVSETYRVMTEFLYLTCCRITECTSLKVGQVDLGGGWVTFTHTKGKKVRRIPIQEPLVSDLMPYIRNKNLDEYVFLNKNGHPVGRSNYWRDLQTRAKEAGIAIKIHPHTLRHSGASHLVINGVPIELVSKLLGHEDVGLTMSTYVHLKDEQIKNAMFSMPYYQEHTDPKEILYRILSTIKSFRLQDDKRFDFKLLQSNNSLNLTLYVK